MKSRACLLEAGAALAALTLVAGACRGGGSTSAPNAIIVLYAGSDETVFGPSMDDSPKFLVFLPLVTYQRCTEGAPGLAERWEHSSDWRTWTVTLRRDVRWHDGVPMTAHDVAFSIRLWKHPDVDWYGAAAVDSVEVLDDYTLRFHLKRPGTWPAQGWDVFYPKHLLEHLDPRGFFEWDFWAHPVGNGPFRYVRHVPKTMVELEANPDYVGGRPRIDRVVIRFVAGGAGTGLMELKAGEADMAEMSPLDALAVAEDPRFHVYYDVAGVSRWLIWNYRDERFAAKEVRRALTQAIDRRLLARTLGLPEGLPITDAAYTTCQLDRGELIEPWPYDPAAARGLLTAAGWRDADGDGIRERNGRPFKFTLLTGERYHRQAVFIQAQLREVGVRAELRLLDNQVVRRRFQDGEFEAIIPRLVGPEGIIAGPRSPLGVLDARLAKLIADAEAEPDLDRRTALYRELGPLYRDLAPATFLHLEVEALVAHRRIRGLGEPGGIVRRPTWRWIFGGLEYLWVEASDR